MRLTLISRKLIGLVRIQWRWTESHGWSMCYKMVYSLKTINYVYQSVQWERTWYRKNKMEVWQVTLEVIKPLDSWVISIFGQGWGMKLRIVYVDVEYASMPREEARTRDCTHYFLFQLGIEILWVWISFWVYQELRGEMILYLLLLIESLRWNISFRATRLVMPHTFLTCSLIQLWSYMVYLEALYQIEMWSSWLIFGGPCGRN